MTQDEVTEEDGSVRLSLDDVEDVRKLTPRGQQILEMITRRAPKQTASSATQTRTTSQTTRSTGTEAPLEVAQPRVATRARAQQTKPTQSITVRLTRSRVAMLREAAQTSDDEAAGGALEEIGDDVEQREVRKDASARILGALLARTLYAAIGKWRDVVDGLDDSPEKKAASPRNARPPADVVRRFSSRASFEFAEPSRRRSFDLRDVVDLDEPRDPTPRAALPTPSPAPPPKRSAAMSGSDALSPSSVDAERAAARSLSARRPGERTFEAFARDAPVLCAPRGAAVFPNISRRKFRRRAPQVDSAVDASELRSMMGLSPIARPLADEPGASYDDVAVPRRTFAFDAFPVEENSAPVGTFFAWRVAVEHFSAPVGRMRVLFASPVPSNISAPVGRTRVPLCAARLASSSKPSAP